MPGKIVVYKAITDEGESYWPEVFPVDVLSYWKKELGPISFASQYQSSPIDLSGNDLKLEWLHFYHFQDDLPEEFEKILIFIDPAISRTKTSDYFALAVAGRANNRVYILDLLRTKAPLETQLEIINDKFAIWNPDEIVIEAGGQQLYFVEYIVNNTMYNITTPDKNWHRSDKKTKFESLAAHLNASRALLPGFKDDLNRWVCTQEFIPFIEEWTQFPDGIHDDTIDAVAGAVASLISTTIPYGRTEPDDLEEVIEFVKNAYEDSHNKELSEEDIQILRDYYENESNTNIRKNGFMANERRPTIRINH